MLGITPFGAVHTAISLAAMGAGIAAFMRNGGISPRDTVGRVYIVMTILTCVTGFFIFHHGGFGKPHALGIITLLVLGVAGVAGYSGVFGRASRYIETVAYSSTFFFHWIPAITETSTRLPPDAPLAAGAEAPALQTATGILFLVFLIGVAVQVKVLRKTPV
jgi:uncharacterized membrane protein